VRAGRRRGPFESVPFFSLLAGYWLTLAAAPVTFKIIR
jgi:hypothetical protein